MATDDGPIHEPAAKSVTTVWNDDADDHNSAASPSQAEAASNRGPEPAPPAIRAELISGGKNTNAGIIRNPNRPS